MDPKELDEAARAIWIAIYAARLERCLWEIPPMDEQQLRNHEKRAAAVADRVIKLRRGSEDDRGQ